MRGTALARLLQQTRAAMFVPAAAADIDRIIAPAVQAGCKGVAQLAGKPQEVPAAPLVDPFMLVKPELQCL